MSDADITYIELAENKSSEKIQNGEYNINIDKPITIYQGDQVSFYKSFIDTTFESNKIKFENDLELEMSYIMYARNWWTGLSNYNGNDLTTDGKTINSGRPDNDDYMVCNVQRSEPANVVTCIAIEYGHYRTRSLLTPGGFTGIYEYIDPQGNEQKTHIYIPQAEGGTSGTPVFISTAPKNPIAIRCIENTFKDITPKSLIKKHILDKVQEKKIDSGYPKFAYTDKLGATETIDFHLTPFIQTKKINILKGDYDPQTLAERITEKLTKIDENVFGDDPVAESPFFLASGDDLAMRADIPDVAGKCGVLTSDAKALFQPIAQAEGGTNDFKYIVGASQLALEFQDNTIFTWAFMHTPFYVGASGTTKNIGLAYTKLNDVGANDGKYKIVNKYGGIAFHSLTANEILDDGTKEPFDFWEGILKFDVGNICVQSEDAGPFTFPNTSKQFTSTKLKVPLQDSVNTTGGLVSIDSTVDKGSDIPFSYSSLSGDLALQTEITGTFGIQALIPYNVSKSYKSPYFRVDIGCSIKNKIVGEKTLFRNTMAIVGRYYELNSYNTGTQSDALNYIHYGSPVVLSGFNVRILDDEGNTPEQLGENNTLFLQIIKNRNREIERPLKQKKKKDDDDE